MKNFSHYLVLRDVDGQDQKDNVYSSSFHLQAWIDEKVNKDMHSPICPCSTRAHPRACVYPRTLITTQGTCVTGLSLEVRVAERRALHSCAVQGPTLASCVQRRHWGLWGLLSLSNRFIIQPKKLNSCQRSMKRQNSNSKGQQKRNYTIVYTWVR